MKKYWLTWGRQNESGIWFAQKSRFRFMFRNHDALYVAFFRLRFRLIR